MSLNTKKSLITIIKTTKHAVFKVLKYVMKAI